MTFGVSAVSLTKKSLKVRCISRSMCFLSYILISVSTLDANDRNRIEGSAAFCRETVPFDAIKKYMFDKIFYLLNFVEVVTWSKRRSCFALVSCSSCCRG